MGLHLNYELRLPGYATPGEVTALLERAHAFAHELPFERVTEFHRPEPGPRDSRAGGLRFLASVIDKVAAEEDLDLVSDLDSVRGFTVWPGRGCETAAFALMKRADRSGARAEWFWHTCCKTQYASVISEEHLVACHTGLVSLLDYAIKLGVGVIVRDETCFWETRDEQRLITEVRRMNRIVAAIAGRLADIGFPGTGELRAPIFAHPRFERLEVGLED
ncbi:MAG TPA: hypothetical protein VJ816_08180 [Gemmatimonadales bacterium]|nr:hypothetical protein [Gemmatimonadales bacterium]